MYTPVSPTEPMKQTKPLKPTKLVKPKAPIGQPVEQIHTVIPVKQTEQLDEPLESTEPAQQTESKLLTKTS